MHTGERRHCCSAYLTFVSLEARNGPGHKVTCWHGSFWGMGHVLDVSICQAGATAGRNVNVG